MSDHDWFCEKLNRLKIDEDRLTTLNEIRTRLNESESLETVVAGKLLSSPEIFQCMDVSSQR